MAVTTRSQRTEMRLLPDQKKRIERAASIKGVSVSDFMVQNADEAAIRTIESHESWILTEAERDQFLQTVLNPPEPGPRLRAAFQRLADEHLAD